MANKVRKGVFIVLADYHVHTESSDDSEYLMEECIKKAIQILFSLWY